MKISQKVSCFTSFGAQEVLLTTPRLSCTEKKIPHANFGNLILHRLYLTFINLSMISFGIWNLIRPTEKFMSWKFFSDMNKKEKKNLIFYKEIIWLKSKKLEAEFDILFEDLIILAGGRHLNFLEFLSNWNKN